MNVPPAWMGEWMNDWMSECCLKLLSDQTTIADLRDPAGLVPGNDNKASITVKQVTWIFFISQCIEKLCLHYTIVY